MILQQATDSIFNEKKGDFYKKGGCVEFVIFENFQGKDSYFKHLEVAKNTLMQNCTDWEKDFENSNRDDENCLELIYPNYFDLEILKPSGIKITLQEFLGPYYDLKMNKVILRGQKTYLNTLFHYDELEKIENHINYKELIEKFPYSNKNYISFGFCDAFLDPPHSLDIGKNIKQRGQYFIDFITYFFSELDLIEIYKWSTDCSDYFEMGKEWWGSFFWTVYNPVKNIYIGIIASTTD